MNQRLRDAAVHLRRMADYAEAKAKMHGVTEDDLTNHPDAPIPYRVVPGKGTHVKA